MRNAGILTRLALSAWMVMTTAPAAQVPDNFAYTVAYFEVAPASARAAIDLLKQYREASRAEDGLDTMDLFHQIDRPGHFVFAEAWKDQTTFTAHAMAASTRQLEEKLRPLRIGPVDQRPYKSLAVGPRFTRPTGQAVYVVAHVDTIPSPGSDGPGLLRRLAEESRRDAGNLRFDVWQHTMRANHFTIVEAWQDQKALDAHAAATHTKQHRETLLPLAGSPVDERVYKAIE
jgi:quinol monooxygenase YgiN